MPLHPGLQLGPYEVVAPIGEGGMGEVWQATDTQLNRQVALKILPDAFADDPDRLARFQREAQVLASLNHPNIAAIHGIEKSDDAQALVLELVEGPTLEDRIATGPIPIDEALPIAKQIAEALEAAHEAGVIHRDLKPANIKVREDGTVKVLDFGLAKALDAAPDGDPSQSPTMTAAATQMGVILGTAAYMAPEQARGKAVDRRADVWALGVVLFEMLTGRLLFAGDDVSLTLANVLTRPVDWSALPAEVPPRVRYLLKRMLDRDPARRLRDSGEARMLLTDDNLFPAPAEIVASTQARDAGRQPRWLPWATAAGATLLTALGFWSVPAEETAQPITRFSVQPRPMRVVGNYGLALSPDGRTLVFSGAERGGGLPMLFRRDLDRLEAVAIEGTALGRNPVFSTDGDRVAFQSGDKLQSVSLDGRPPVTLADLPGVFAGASWGPAGDIIYAYLGSSSLWSVPGAGGDAVEIPLSGREASVSQPSHLPGGEYLLGATSSDQAPSDVVLISLETGEVTTLFPGSHPMYASTGHIAFVRDGAIWAVPFDLERRIVAGAPAPIVDDISVPRGGQAAALSASGSLAYWPESAADASSLLVWVDQDGQEEPLGVEAANFVGPRLSPDGATVAVERDGDIWVYDVRRGTGERITFDDGVDDSVTWTPDGERVAFYSTGRDGGPGIFWQSASSAGEAERLATGSYRPETWLADGSQLVYLDAASGWSIGGLDVAEGTTQTLVDPPGSQVQPSLSADGRWLAVESNETGRMQVFVYPFSDIDSGGTRMSLNGGTDPVWARDGSALFFWSADGMMMAVAVGDGAPGTWSTPRPLFERRYRSAGGARNYDVGGDGRFLMVKRAPGAQDGALVVVEHWTNQLAGLVGTPD